MTRPILVEFAEPEPLLAAVRELNRRGYSRIQAYSPVEIEGLAELLPRPRGGHWRGEISAATFLGGILGGAMAFGFQTWAMAIDWTLDVGGREPVSWPAFIVPTFECTILGASLTALISFIAFSHFPSPYHRVFDFPAFERASADRMFLWIDLDEPGVVEQEIRAVIDGFGPLEVHDYPA